MTNLSVKELNDCLVSNFYSKETKCYYFLGFRITQTGNEIFSEINILPFICRGFLAKRINSYKYLLRYIPDRESLVSHLESISPLLNTLVNI